MTSGMDSEGLQRQLSRWAEMPDDELEMRYALRRPPRPPGLYWQLRWLAGKVLRSLHTMGILRQDTWPAALLHGAQGRGHKPLLIWALGVDREPLRDACQNLADSLARAPDIAPVLVTDVADFAFFSRLGWLVEYVPDIAGAGEPFPQRKIEFLARLYRGAPVVPASLGLEPSSDVYEYLRRSLESAPGT